MNYTVKYFLVDIADRKGFVSVREYPKRKFIVQFVNDEFSDFINSFDTKGFGIDAVDSSDPVFHVSQKLTEEEAKKIWEQITNRLNDPDHIVELEGFKR